MARHGYRRGRGCSASIAVGAPYEIVVAATVTGRARPTLGLRLLRLPDDLSLPVVAPALGVCQHSLDFLVWRLVDGTTGQLQDANLQRGNFRGIPLF